MMKREWKLGHVGLVVRDWEATLGYYQTTGMGISVGPQIVTMDFEEGPGGEPGSYFNQEIFPISGGSGPGNPLKFGPGPSGERKSSTYKFMDKDCQVGTLLLEILRDRRIPFEGVSHLCFNVPDVDAETKKLTEKGCGIVLSFTRGERVLENYIDTRKFGHVIISFRPQVAKWEKAWTAHNSGHPLLKGWKFHGLGIGVNDLDAAVDYYESLEFAAFEDEGTIEGEGPNGAAKARSRVGQIGDVAYEFVQPLEGDAVYRESLDSRGEGICDISFIVDDLEAETANLAGRGVEVLLSGNPASGPAFAYFDTREFSGNVMIRLIQKD